MYSCFSMKLRTPRTATVWAIFASVFYFLCFPRFDIPVFSLIFFPCLLLCVHALESRKQAVMLGFLSSTVIALGGEHWVLYGARNFGLPFPMALGLMLVFCLIAAPQALVFLIIGERVCRRMERLPLSLRPLFWASLYVALEYVAHFIKIFPDNLGNTMIAYLDIAQIASLGGVPLLSFLPLFLGASFYYVGKAGRQAWPSVAIAGLLILSSALWGRQERIAVAGIPSEILRVGLIQANMVDSEKLLADATTKTAARAAINSLVGRLLEKTRVLAESNPRPDLVLWPETAYPMDFPVSNESGDMNGYVLGYSNLLENRVRLAKVPLLFGGYVKNLNREFNAGILLGAAGDVEAVYKKRGLLIFGEYFPFEDWFPSLKKINPRMGNFSRGPGPLPIPFPWKGGTIQIGVSICYEALLPEYMRGYVTTGARLFINLSKDSWFGDTFEPWHHFQLSELRSIEHRIPMIRSTNTGLSGLVLPTGEVKLLSAPFHEAYQVLEVPLQLTPRTTIYTLLGEWFAWLTIAVSLGLGILGLRREIRSRRSSG